jgi:ankyrin repeat protein
MALKISRLLALVLSVLALGLAGCATVGGSGGGDAESINNALATDDVHFVRGAIQSGTLKPDQRVSTAGYPDGAPLMAIAARAASLEVMRFLISAGADLNARTPVGETPLMLAAFFFDETQASVGRAHDRHEQAVRLLVTSGAQVDNLPYHYTPLAYAAYQGNDRVVRYLIERGAQVNASAADGGTYVNTPLMMAAIQGHESIARLLLRAGADADIRVYGGHTAAELAAKYNHTGLAQLLLCAQRQYGVAASGPQCRQLLGYDPLQRQRGTDQVSR